MMDLNIQKIYDNFYILREDLLPISFGGNKYRIAKEFIDDLKNKGNDFLVGYGNSRSNLSRILTVLCKMNNIPCTIVSPYDDDGKRVETNNSKLCNFTDSHFIYCTKTEVSKTIDNVIREAKNAGFNPYYINGDIFGNGNEKTYVKAYFEVYKELTKYNFDYIFLSTGTGMTQAGLIAGKHYYSGKEKIIGISISREKLKEESIIKKYVDSFFEKNVDCEINVCDDYLFGGYGKFNKELADFIIDFYNKYGIPLDPIYAGKGMYGTFDYLKSKSINDNKVLFIHTGGIPLFFDFINNKIEETYNIELNNSFEEIKNFINSVDNSFVHPLKTRVNISDYINKILENGLTLSVKVNNHIKSLLLFYCNDLMSKTAYISYVATSEDSKGKNYALTLMKTVEEIAKKKEMQFIKLETDITNYKAISLYSKLGFLIDNIDNKVIMKKEIK